MAPMMLRDALLFGRFTPMSDRNGGSVLFFAGTFGKSEQTTVAHAMDLAETVEPGFKSRGLQDEELHSAFFRFAIRRILADPWSYCGKCLYRWTLIWKRLAVYSALGLCALALLPRRRELQGLALVVLSFSGYAFGDPAPEHLAPLVPIFIALAACAPVAAWGRLRRLPAETADHGLPRSLVLSMGAFAVFLYAGVLGFLSLELHDHWRPGWRGAKPAAAAPDDRELEVLRRVAELKWGDDGSANVLETYRAALLSALASARARGDLKRGADLQRALRWSAKGRPEVE